MRSRLGLLLIAGWAAAEHHCPARTEGDDVANVHINGAAVGCYTGPCERCLAGAEFDDLREEFADVARTKTITVEMQNWVSSQINSQVARILFEELLGYEVNVVPRSDTSKIPERLASGATDYNGEIWGAEATKQADFEKWAARDAQQCFDFRFNGVTGEEKLYAPTYIADDNICSAYSAEATQNLDLWPADGSTRITESMRATCEGNSWPESNCSNGRWVPPHCETAETLRGKPSPFCSELLLQDPNYAAAWFEAAIRNLRLNFTTLYVPNLREEVTQRYKRKENFAFYWFAPDPLFLDLELRELSLPPWSQSCQQSYTNEPSTSGVNCGKNSDALVSGLHSETKRSEKDIAYFHDTFLWAPGQIETIMKETIAIGGDKTVEEATCEWLLDHVDVWRPAIKHIPDDVYSSSRKKRESIESKLAYAGVALAIGLVLAALVACACSTQRFVKKSRTLLRERQENVEDQIRAATEQVSEFQAHFTVVPGSIFCSLGSLPRYESLSGEQSLSYQTAWRVRRAQNRGEVFVFLSHQWLGDAPDPEGVHYSSMVAAVKNVSTDSHTPLEQLRVWVDVASIPQENRAEQRLAIASLPTFASCCDYFVAVVPETTHAATRLPCDARSYAARCWCRAEVMSCWARNGSRDMYYYRGNGLEKMTFGEEEVAELLDVFSGELSCCRHGHPDAQTCDREELVLPMLGLFIEIYRTRRNGDATPKTRRAYAAMEPLLAQMYPATFEYRRIHADGSETRETCPLFGGLIEAAKFFVDHEDTPDSEMPALPDFEPGTHARRHSRAKPRRHSGGDSVKSGHSGLSASKTSSSFRRSRSFSALTQIRSMSTSATNRSERSVASLPPTMSRPRFVQRDAPGDGHDEDSSSSLGRAGPKGSPMRSRPSFGSMASRRYLPDV